MLNKYDLYRGIERLEDQMRDLERDIVSQLMRDIEREGERFRE